MLKVWIIKIKNKMRLLSIDIQIWWIENLTIIKDLLCMKYIKRDKINQIIDI